MITSIASRKIGKKIDNYLNVTTPLFEFITNEGQSIEKAFVAPASGSVTSKEGSPTVVPA